MEKVEKLMCIICGAELSVNHIFTKRLLQYTADKFNYHNIPNILDAAYPNADQLSFNIFEKSELYNLI